jgi:preprotein translocase subunit SecD
MSRNLKYKALLIVAVVLACVYGIFGVPTSLEEARANFRKNVRLGLDLRGGSHLVLQVQVQDAFKVEADLIMDRLKEDMAKEAIPYDSIDRNEPDSLDTADIIQINVSGVPLDSTASFRDLVTQRCPQWVLTPVSSSDYRLNIRASEAIALRRDTVERSIRTIENRINGLGLTESTVQQRGRSDAESEILVQMPGVDDPARVKAILQTAAMLELTEVLDGPFSSREQALAEHGGVLPLNARLVRQSSRAGDQEQAWWLLNRSAVVTGRDVRNAFAGRDEFGKSETDFTLSQDAARRFGRFTEANIGNRLAIVLDGQIRGNPPTIQSRIDDSGRITGASTQQEAVDLAIVLKAGSLPAGIVYLEERTVGPSLGADSIRQGFVSGTLGVVGVILIMLYYYRKAGVNASLALVLNAVILLAVLSYFDAVLTLPGIAGVILTIGMAVDSNVLIFERIKEELRAGKAIPAAIDTGFSKAFLTIIDTHVTTVVACAFLFIFGSGPVKGFAVTLTIGLIANVFTAIFVSKSLFDYGLFRNPRMERLSI